MPRECQREIIDRGIICASVGARHRERDSHDFGLGRYSAAFTQFQQHRLEFPLRGSYRPQSSGCKYFAVPIAKLGRNRRSVGLPVQSAQPAGESVLDFVLVIDQLGSGSDVDILPGRRFRILASEEVIGASILRTGRRGSLVAALGVIPLEREVSVPGPVRNIRARECSRGRPLLLQGWRSGFCQAKLLAQGPDAGPMRCRRPTP